MASFAQALNQKLRSGLVLSVFVCVCVCVRLNVDLSHMSKPNPRSAVPRGVRAEREHLSIG